MTNLQTVLQTYQSSIEWAIGQFKTAVFSAKGNDGQKVAIVNDQWKLLDERASDVRSKYAEFREETVAHARKQAALNPVNYRPYDLQIAENTANEAFMDLLAANDSAGQNAVLQKLEGTLKYFSADEKNAFRSHLLTINSLLIDKAASNASLLAVINEVRNVANPFEGAPAEAEALPTVIGEEYDTLKAEREAELEEARALAEAEAELEAEKKAELEAEKQATEEPKV